MEDYSLGHFFRPTKLEVYSKLLEDDASRFGAKSSLTLLHRLEIL